MEKASFLLYVFGRNLPTHLPTHPPKTTGLTSPSPLEVRELGVEKAALLVCVFGRNLATKTQEKRSFVTSSSTDQAALSAALTQALEFKQG